MSIELTPREPPYITWPPRFRRRSWNQMSSQQRGTKMVSNCQQIQKHKKCMPTSSKASKISILGWCIVQTTVLPVSTVFRTVRITMAAALASKPEVGSSMKIIDGFATSSTAIVRRFLCSVDNPVEPCLPTNACLS